MGNLDEARSLYEQSAHTYEVSLGADHPEIIGVLAELAEVLEKLGEIDAARTYYERALNIANEKLSPTHPFRPKLSQRYQEFLERNDLMSE